MRSNRRSDRLLRNARDVTGFTQEDEAGRPILDNISLTDTLMNTPKFAIPALCVCLVSTLLLAGCEDPPLKPLSVDQLVDDPVMLDGVLMKCSDRASALRSAEECRNARMAVDRIAAGREKSEAAKREATFEIHRDRLRQQQDMQRRQEEDARKVDPYKLPLVPPAEKPPPAVTASN